MAGQVYIRRMGRTEDAGLSIELRDRFWAPRVERLRTHTLDVVLERLEKQGAIDNFRRVAGRPELARRAMHFSDSDVYKWLEAAILAGRSDLAEPMVELIERVQSPDGYVHTYYGAAGGPPRWSDLDFGHEHYCFGHLIEACVAHRDVTGTDRMLAVARRLADNLCATFGAGRDERTDAHPEVELALCRLGAATGDARYVEHAAWAIERRLADAGTDLDRFVLGGHAVRALYLTSGIAEVALATGDPRWGNAAQRLFDAMVREHAYPTGAVGARWLGESVGRPYEQPDAMAYAESCAAVAAAQLAERVWRLARDPRALDQIELLLFNAVPCGVGAGGDSWFYSQPQAVADVAADPNPWVYGFDYGQLMMREWFPARRHAWFDVPCCPPNLARMFAAVDRRVAELDRASGDLLVHVPLACRIRGAGWDVEVEGDYPFDGAIRVIAHGAPEGRGIRVRRPGWAGGMQHDVLPRDGAVSLPVDWEWWATDHRVEGGGNTVHLRRGPVVYCVEGSGAPGVDLRDLVVDPTLGPQAAFRRRRARPGALHGRWDGRSASEPVAVEPIPYADWANGPATTMRVRFPIG
ncbi:glycoside hydrolase family 127 protein [Candidatus Binatia bacterium]|nr:glycoside hydrolase family 127 protein [Candidatus Binatia bacterium]